MMEEITTDNYVEDFIVSKVLPGSAGTAEQALTLALFLLSDDMSFVTGSQYAIDGRLIHHWSL
ncbi:SDR family oxidoreductase [Pantoea vagans]|nr:SDR family oxidoreductase [Pantoea vagans]MDE8557634.1 SDR family oxidoreductase [Pantoea vagans]MDE8577202.1 SDR family oxidoreductase [Pantoea vagans]